MNFRELENQLKTEAWELKLDCGHTITTVGFSEKEKNTGQIFCPLENVIKPALVVKMRKIILSTVGAE